jgi:hypothetical protein
MCATGISVANFLAPWNKVQHRWVRNYESMMTGFGPSQWFSTCRMEAKEFAGMGMNVPAGSSFINEVSIPVVFQVPWGKTNKGKGGQSDLL